MIAPWPPGDSRIHRDKGLHNLSRRWGRGDKQTQNEIFLENFKTTCGREFQEGQVLQNLIAAGEGPFLDSRTKGNNKNSAKGF